MSCRTCQSEVPTASLEAIRRRRDFCRECDQATRNPAPQFQSGKGLTTLSVCRVCDCPILGLTAAAEKACPATPSKWPAEVSK